MKKIVWIALSCLVFKNGYSQTPKNYSSADILQQLKKLEVFGSVLYVAAHPDDENTRLLAYLANERKFRTGYLSLTRGDGGQNLIGDEQGIDLGLIRTQELLAARRIDGAEQFFSRAYDFGFSKSPDEAMKIWGHDKILSDVVWVIRRFRPDVIITRFPITGEGGHGHHTASAILAGEAFDMAGDSTKFPEQLKQGVTAWQPKRLLWNTFNFGGNNTTREDQLKIEVGMYNPVLGKSYGEIAAESRSQHKSQGFGVPAQRGESFEYFSIIKGNKPEKDLMDGIELGSKRLNNNAAAGMINNIIQKYKPEDPALLLPELVKYYRFLKSLPSSYWKEEKMKDVSRLIETASGIFLEATVPSPYLVTGDSARITFTVNNRAGVDAKNVAVHFPDTFIVLKEEGKNKNSIFNFAWFIPPAAAISQPYWLEKPMDKGSFNVTDQQLIGQAETAAAWPKFDINILGETIQLSRPLVYKFTDPVKGEIYQRAVIVPAVTLNLQPEVSFIRKDTVYLTKKYRLFTDGKNIPPDEQSGDLKNYSKGDYYTNTSLISFPQKEQITEEVLFKNEQQRSFSDLREIVYDHIPAIRYFKPAAYKLVKTDLQIGGTHIGYISGAGDKVPAALVQMGYQVTMLNEKDITPANLKQFDAVITGVRAYNTNLWLSNSSSVLNNYVKEGGVFLVQYNTNNGAGPLRQKIGPYPFTLGRNRVTDETAAVNFLLPNDPSLNYPNKITQKDFEGWIQERSIYHAESIDSNYRRVLSMKDPGEKESDGSLIIADYGKGRFIYTGLVFFRELPAGVPGSYRLLANLLAAPAKSMAVKQAK